MGAKQSKRARERIEQLERELSSSRNALSSAQARLSSTQNLLSSSLANLRDSQEEAEKLTQDKVAREITLKKLIKVLVELGEQVSSTKDEALLSKFNLDRLTKEVEELNQELIVRQKVEENIKIKLKKVMDIEIQLCSMMIAVSSTKDSLEASKKEENMLREQLVTQEKFYKDMETKLQVIMTLENQLLHSKIEETSTKGQFEASKKIEYVLKEELIACEKFHQDMEMKLCNIIDLEKQLLFAKAEGLFVKVSLEASRKKEEGVCKEFMAIEKYQNDMQKKLHKVLELQNELCYTKAEKISNMVSLEALKDTKEELQEKLLACEKVQQAAVELRLLPTK